MGNRGRMVRRLASTASLRCIELRGRCEPTPVWAHNVIAPRLKNRDYTQTQGFTLGYDRAALPGLRNTGSRALILNRAAGFEHVSLLRDLRLRASKNLTSLMACWPFKSTGSMLIKLSLALGFSGQSHPPNPFTVSLVSCQFPLRRNGEPMPE